MWYPWPKVLLIVSSLVTSFFLPSRVFSQPFDFVGPLFSYSYELLFSQPLCFDNDLNCPGGDPIVSLCRRLPRPGRGSKSHVLRALQPLCRLFALFSALAPFVFKSLQPLLPKRRGGGGLRFSRHSFTQSVPCEGPLLLSPTTGNARAVMSVGR